MGKTAEIREKQLLMKYAEMNTKADYCEVFCVCAWTVLQFQFNALPYCCVVTFQIARCKFPEATAYFPEKWTRFPSINYSKKNMTRF
jgi:hypothetical protein